ncbi:unnamed protein product [Porites lobata]|uniref:Mitochondrial import receptor subunit TOM20 homolog n=1 Tax=Porites lobata TaxID=104759 RepID=A0ABN8NL09_9CNID|nr:unnamed protein product [Porites lobata]
MSSRLMAGIVAGICGTFFLGYCIYFDRKRRSDPLFKQKLRERRRKAKQAQQESSMEELRNRIPDRNDAAAVQQFFMEEIQIGEDLIHQGETDEGINHLINAVTVCGQPQQLLQLFRSTLDDEPFQKLLEKLSSMASNPMVQQVHPAGFSGDSLD